MKVERFLKIVEEIEYSCLSSEQQEEMIIQVADLNRFIESYDPTIEILSWMRYKVSIIEHCNSRKGVVFCDGGKLSSINSYYSNPNLIALKKQEDLRELWLVHVTNCPSNELRSLIKRVENKSLDNIYDKIFSLDFLRSKIQTLK